MSTAREVTTETEYSWHVFPPNFDGRAWHGRFGVKVPWYVCLHSHKKAAAANDCARRWVDGVNESGVFKPEPETQEEIRDSFLSRR